MKVHWPMEFPVIESSRLKFIQLTPNHLPELILKCNDFDISKQTYNLPFPYTMGFAESRLSMIQEKFLEKTGIVWLLISPENNEIVGEIGIHVRSEIQNFEVGYWIAKDFWGGGYATEALKRVLDYSRIDLKWPRVYGTCFADNLASGRVMEKAGMIREQEIGLSKNQQGEEKGLFKYSYFI
jgi:RimJ/RimL family protein N-acetyltransferase